MDPSVDSAVPPPPAPTDSTAVPTAKSAAVPQQQQHRSSIRHVEARRIGTCRWANRVAAVSVEHYNEHVVLKKTQRTAPHPQHQQQQQPSSSLRNHTTTNTTATVVALSQTCLATVVAYDKAKDTVTVLAMGVGTKFLSEAILNNHDNKASLYGERVRDCHAEVLARRSLRRHVTNEWMRLRSLQDEAVIHCSSSSSSSDSPFWSLTKDGCLRLQQTVTLHFYCSSTPCGNSTIKKFGTLQKEIFRDDLTDTEWPTEPHDPLPCHSIPLGQCALLVKKDSTCLRLPTQKSTDTLGTAQQQHSPQQHQSSPSPPPPPSRNKRPRSTLSKKQATWPIYCETSWCPPGTTTVWTGLGSLHTCSDKLARWNCLGWQGSLLSATTTTAVATTTPSTTPTPRLAHALSMTTMTVGRKFSRMTCARAVCCRVVSSKPPSKHRPSWSDAVTVHHPTLLGTSVYLDDTGVIDTASDQTDHVRFPSSLSYVSWLEPSTGKVAVECIDAATGWLQEEENGNDDDAVGGRRQRRSQVSTAALVESLLGPSYNNVTPPVTLADLRRLKQRISPNYEEAKTQLLMKHPVFRDWRRRWDETDHD